MQNEIKTNEKPDFLSEPWDADCCCLNTDEEGQFLQAMRNIAETAVRENFGKLDIRAVEIYNSLKDKNEALFQEWLHG